MIYHFIFPVTCSLYTCSVFCRFYSDDWLNEDLARKCPHRDSENLHERIKCFRRLFPSNEDHMKVMEEYALFSMKSGPFEDLT